MKTTSPLFRFPLAASTGLAATLAWAIPATAQIQWSQPDQVGPRANPAAAFDSARDRLVLIGGGRGFIAGSGTWEWDGTDWLRRTSPNSPPIATMSFPQMVYDRTAGVCLLHCRFGGNPLHAETWTWDGADWTRHQDAPINAYLAFDAVAGRPVLLERTSGSTPHELHEWDGVQWVARATSGTKPTWFDIGQLACDAARGCLVFPVPNAVYELHGTVWQRIVAANPPIATSNYPLHTATYDPRTGGVVLYGGELWPTTLGNAAVWDGTTWTTLPAGRPRQQHVAVFDDVRNRLLAFGGADYRNTFYPQWRYLDDLSSFDGTWTTIYDATPPSHLDGIAAAYDRGRDVVTTFGGSWDNVPTDEVHEFDGARWRVEEPPVRPSARRSAVMVWDGTGQRLVLFGGRDSGGAWLGDTWVHDASGWHQLATSGAPAPRAGARMAFDPGRGVVVLVGGETATGTSSETWELGGSTWLLRTAGYPPASAYGGLAHDPTRGRTVLYGGYSGDATYEWNGNAWFSTNPTHRPLADVQGQCAMTFDEARARTVLVVQALNGARTWEWDGADWTETTVPIPPPTYVGIENFVHHAGSGSNVLVPDQTVQATTLLYSSVNPAAWRTYGSGCAGAGTEPTLQPIGLSRPWLGDTFQLRLQHPAAVLGAVSAGLSDSNWSGGALPFALGPAMPGCDLLASPDAFVILALQQGAADYALAVPVVAAFLGMDVFFQGFALEAAANAAGIVVSDGVHATIGVR